MDEPKVFKRPERAKKEVKKAILAELAKHPAPEPKEEEPAEDEEVEQEPKRFGTGDPIHEFTVVLDEVEYCVDVVDPESERVWLIAVWSKPPAADGLPESAMSHCMVIGSKNEARERLGGMENGPEYIPRKDEANDPRGPRKTGAASSAVTRRSREAQKQG